VGRCVVPFSLFVEHSIQPREGKDGKKILICDIPQLQIIVSQNSEIGMVHIQSSTWDCFYYGANQVPVLYDWDESLSLALSHH